MHKTIKFSMIAFVIISLVLTTNTVFSKEDTNNSITNNVKETKTSFNQKSMGAVFTKKYIRETGKPVETIDNFSASDGLYEIVIQNGDSKQTRVSSAVIEINGVIVVSQSDFSKQEDLIKKSITLKDANEIKVTLNSGPNCFIIINITKSNSQPDNDQDKEEDNDQDDDQDKEEDNDQDDDQKNNPYEDEQDDDLYNNQMLHKIIQPYNNAYVQKDSLNVEWLKLLNIMEYMVEVREITEDGFKPILSEKLPDSTEYKVDESLLENGKSYSILVHAFHVGIGGVITPITKEVIIHIEETKNEISLFHPYVRMMGHEYEQTYDLSTTSIPPQITNVNIDCIDTENGIYKLSISDVTLDENATPFYFWKAFSGVFFDPSQDYREVKFQPDEGTENFKLKIIAYVGDGLGYIHSQTIFVDGRKAENIDNVDISIENIPKILTGGTNYDVQYKLNNISNEVRIDVSLIEKDKDIFSNIISGVSSNGFKWEIPNIDTTDAKLMFRIYVGDKVTVKYSNEFTINKSAIVDGHVLDINNEPLVGAVITLGNYTTITDSDGYYCFMGVLKGYYSLKASLDDYSFDVESYDLIIENTEKITKNFIRKTN